MKSLLQGRENSGSDIPLGAFFADVKIAAGCTRGKGAGAVQHTAHQLDRDVIHLAHVGNQVFMVFLLARGAQAALAVVGAAFVLVTAGDDSGDPVKAAGIGRAPDPSKVEIRILGGKAAEDGGGPGGLH